MIKMKSSPAILMALCLMLLPAGVVATEGPGAGAAIPQFPETETRERLLVPLAAGFTRALGSDAFRQRVFEKLDESPYVEGRVPLKRLLAQDAALRDELLWQADIDGGWDRVASTVPELELYFPVDSHRSAWTGDLAVQVAVPAASRDVYQVYTPHGTRVTLDSSALADSPTPTLVLGPSEIDFDDSGSALVGGRRTGGYLLQSIKGNTADDGGGAPLNLFSKDQISATASGVDNSRHTYLTYFRINDDRDGVGSMEIEVFGSVDGSYSWCQRFTDIEEDVSYFLPPPGSTGDEKIAFAVPTGTNTADVEVYEDDDTGCEIKGSDDFAGVANIQLSQYGSIWGTSNGDASVRVGTQDTTCGDSACEGDESASNCCGDCATCGDGVCHRSCEDGSSCSADCYTCGDGVCESSKGENNFNCSQDCDSCGNGFCEPGQGEDEFSCPMDCCGGAIICPE